MITRRVAATAALVALVILAMLPTMVYAQRGRLRDRDKPSVNRREIETMIDEGLEYQAQAVVLRREAIEARIPDKSKPHVEPKEGEKPEPRWIELKDSERLKRFAQARQKHELAMRKVLEIEAFTEQHPGLVIEGRIENAKEKLTREYVVTLVAETRFRMEKKLGTIKSWIKSADLALKIDKDSAEAQRLKEELEQVLEEQKKQKADTDSDDEEEKKTDEEESATDDAPAEKAPAEEESSESSTESTEESGD